MKLDTLLCSCNNSDLNPKPGKRILAGKLPGGCYRSRRKIAMTTNRGVVAVPRGWFGVVKKKLHVKTKLTPHNNKNIIIIHNNTSITSNEEDNRASSCVEPGKDQIATKNNKVVGGQEDQDLKDLKKQKPGDGVVVKTTVIDDSMKDVAIGDRKSVDIKDQKETPSAGVAQVDESVMADGETKTEIKGGGQEEESKKSKDDNEDDQDENDINVEENSKLALRNADVEAVTQRKAGEEEKQAELSDEEKAVAAITIQTAFRSHLARRAFRALKSLVRLQAVARGVVVRRQARMALHCMRALVRLGDRVRARQLLTTSSHE